jgi:hypothetical protein
MSVRDNGAVNICKLTTPPNPRVTLNLAFDRDMERLSTGSAETSAMESLR